jgi:3-hydroxyisobutyrate dehydrogenase
VPEKDVVQIFSFFNPVTMAPARAERMRGADLTQPSWTLAMARKDARLMLETAESQGEHLLMVPAIAAEMDRWLAAGHAAHDWMIMGKGDVAARRETAG